MNFAKWVSTANAFVNEVCEELDIDDRDRSARMIRTVLHALRARLSPEQSLHLMAQLPMLLKAIYVDGWRLSRSADPGISTEEDFLYEMLRDDGRFGHADFPDRTDARRAAIAVLRVMSRHVSAGEMDDVAHSMPASLRRLVDEARHAA